MQPKWKPSPIIKASAVIHIGAAAAMAGGLSWPWAAGILLLNHVGITAAGLWPRSTLLGANVLILPEDARLAGEIAITIDDGPNPEVTPKVLDILDEFNAKASFFCIGRAIETYPDLACEILSRGHMIENHTYSHPHHFSLMGMGKLREEIMRAQTTIVQITGHSPRYFRAPAGLRNPFLDPVLQSLDLKLVTWTHRGFDTVTTNPDSVLARLQTHLKPGHIILLHDGHCALTVSGKPVILEVLPKFLKTLLQKDFRAVPLPYAA
jgi:peptidoglycan-N-acetylglucosamine deacetylase